MSDPYVGRSFPSTTAFKDNILAGRVLFCTGGGSGICNKMVEVRLRPGAEVEIPHPCMLTDIRCPVLP